MERDKYGHYVNNEGVEIKASTSSSGKDKIDIYDRCAADPDHKSIHINFDSDSGKGTITDTTSGKAETTNIGCYLTTACMKHFNTLFDDNCYELTVLRWFRDNYVSKEDIEHYYTTAPIIVESINNEKENDIIYNYIYDNIVDVCVSAIEKGNYEFAYNRYKSSILSLEETFAKPVLQNRLIKSLKYRRKTLI